MIHWIYNTLHEGGYSLKLILEYLKRYKLWFVLNVISVFGFALVELGIPTIIAYMIDQGVMNEDRGFLMKMGALTAVISLAPGFPPESHMTSDRTYSGRCRPFPTAR